MLLLLPTTYCQLPTTDYNFRATSVGHRWCKLGTTGAATGVPWVDMYAYMCGCIQKTVCIPSQRGAFFT